MTEPTPAAPRCPLCDSTELVHVLLGVASPPTALKGPQPFVWPRVSCENCGLILKATYTQTYGAAIAKARAEQPGGKPS